MIVIYFRYQLHNHTINNEKGSDAKCTSFIYNCIYMYINLSYFYDK